MKYLLWALLIYLAWRWYTAQKQKGEAPAPEQSASDPPAAQGTVEAMVQCASCGIHLPLSEALPAPGDRHYCSEAHRIGHQSH